MRFLGRETVLDFAAQEPTPGVQIDFQQVVAELGFKGLPLVGQERRCGVLCPAQGRGVGLVKAEIHQGPAGGPGLLEALRGECGQVIATLDAVLNVEAA